MFSQDLDFVRKQEKFYRDLLNNLSDGVYFTDLHRRITFWNKGAERLTGYSQEEVLGRRCSDNILVHVDHAGRNLCVSECPLDDCMGKCVTHEAEIFLHHKEGHRVPVIVRVSPIQDDTGKVIGAVEIFSNNSAKIQLETRLRRFVFLI